MDEIFKIAQQHNLIVIEDACHALGSRRKSIDVGKCHASHMTMFSFHPVKNIAMGEGGIITTNDRALYERMVSLPYHGMSRDVSQFINTDIAFDEEGLPNPWYYGNA